MDKSATNRNVRWAVDSIILYYDYHGAELLLQRMRQERSRCIPEPGAAHRWASNVLTERFGFGLAAAVVQVGLNKCWPVPLLRVKKSA